MKNRVGSASVIAVLCLVGCGRPADTPTPEKAGLWRLVERTGAPVSSEFKVEYCAPIRYRPPISSPLKEEIEWRRCEKQDFAAGLGKFERVLRCPSRLAAGEESRKMTITTRLEGDFGAVVRESTSAVLVQVAAGGRDQEGYLVLPKRTVTTAEVARTWQRVGACPKGMAPGDRRGASTRD